MAICPFAIWKPLPANSTQSHITPRAVILHTAVDAPGYTDLWGWFNQSGLESHFFVHNDGSIHQYMDTNVRADANRDANAFAVSIETEDDGAPNTTPWNSAMLSSIIRLVTWVCDTHGVPKSRIQSWDGSGIGWHAMWGAPSHWTPSAGKTCPGPARIPQVTDIIIPQVAGGQQEIDVNWNDTYTYNNASGTWGEPHPVSYVEGANFFRTADSYKILTGEEGADYPNSVGKRVSRVEAKVDALSANIQQAVGQAVSDYFAANPPTVSVDVAAIAEAVLDEQHRRTEA